MHNTITNLYVSDCMELTCKYVLCYACDSLSIAFVDIVSDFIREASV